MFYGLCWLIRLCLTSTICFQCSRLIPLKLKPKPDARQRLLRMLGFPFHLGWRLARNIDQRGLGPEAFALNDAAVESCRCYLRYRPAAASLTAVTVQPMPTPRLPSLSDHDQLGSEVRVLSCRSGVFCERSRPSIPPRGAPHSD